MRALLISLLVLGTVWVSPVARGSVVEFVVRGEGAHPVAGEPSREGVRVGDRVYAWQQVVRVSGVLDDDLQALADLCWRIDARLSRGDHRGAEALLSEGLIDAAAPQSETRRLLKAARLSCLLHGERYDDAADVWFELTREGGAPSYRDQILLRGEPSSLEPRLLVRAAPSVLRAADLPDALSENDRSVLRVLGGIESHRASEESNKRAWADLFHEKGLESWARGVVAFRIGSAIADESQDPRKLLQAATWFLAVPAVTRWKWLVEMAMGRAAECLEEAGDKEAAERVRAMVRVGGD